MGGSATTQFAIPNLVSLVGASLFDQVVHFEMDQSMNLLAIHSTNGIALTIGTF